MPYVGPENVPGRGINALDTATNVGGDSAGLQAVLAQLRARGVTKIDANAIRSLVNENARDPGSADVNPQTLGPAVLNLRNAGIEDASPMPSRGGGGGNTSALPTPPTPPAPSNTISDAAASVPPPPAGDAGGGGSSLLQSLAPLLAGAGAAAFPLGRYILDRARAGGAPGVAPPVVPSPVAVEAGTVPSGPGFDPEYGPARPATPPTQPASGPRAPVEPVVPPVAPTAPTGAGFSPEYGASPATAPVPETPASAATRKAVPDNAPVAARAKVKARARFKG